MKKTLIYITLISLSVCAVETLAAQVADPTQMQFYSMERIQSKNNWLQSANPAGLVFNNVSKSYAEARYGVQDGTFRSFDEGSNLSQFDLKTESFRRLEKLSLFGRMEYLNDRSTERAWSGTIHPEKSTMTVGDPIPGDVRQESYLLTGGVGYELNNRLVLGAMVSYEASGMAKRKDPRSENYYMNLDLRPGFMLHYQGFSAGANLTFTRTAESIGYNTFGTNETNPIVYFFDGLWFYSDTFVFAGAGATFKPVRYKGSTYGGDVQVEFAIMPDFNFFSQFSMEYGYMQRFYLKATMDDKEKLGDDKTLKYSYLGMFSLRKPKMENILKVNLCFGELMKFNNIQQLEKVEGYTYNQFKQYGKILKLTGETQSIGADYFLHVLRNDWNASWMVNVGASYTKRFLEYRVLPARYKQQVEKTEFHGSVAKNFITGRRSFLDITAEGGLCKGSGYPFNQEVPQGMTLGGLSNFPDMAVVEFNYLSADYYHFGGKVRFTCELPTRWPMSIYIQAGATHKNASKGMPDTYRNGLMGTIGVNF